MAESFIDWPISGGKRCIVNENIDAGREKAGAKSECSNISSGIVKGSVIVCSVESTQLILEGGFSRAV